MKRNVRLTDGRIMLRPYRPSDAEPVYEAVRESLPELLPWMPWAYPEYSIKDTRAWIASSSQKWTKGNEYNFAILDARDSAFLGGCGFNKIAGKEGFANLGYWVRTTRTKQGIALAAAQLLARFGFEELKLRHIEIGAATGNKISQRVAGKLGAKRIGIKKNDLKVRDRVYSCAVFALHPQDLEKQGEV
ncbi:MAG: GNAT family N-acetyltransferase [Chloroflexi bacterium]|nr:GNAT family N-acetyltransferase [Chloroflexota bacterium]